MNPIHAFLGDAQRGGKQAHERMMLFPLLMSDRGVPDYLTLDEALAGGAVEITEIGEGGRVPELKLINKSPEKILVVDGEELVGAKQNRIVNASFLIAGQGGVIIPVSCVEHGRWTSRSRKFASGGRIMPATLKRAHQAKVAFSLGRGAGFRSDQHMIWDELAAKAERMAVRSSTGAMSDLFEGHNERLSDYLKAFRLVECQVGGIFAINGEVVGLECFGHSQTFGKFFKKLVQSYALDALDGDSEAENIVSIEAVKNFLEKVQMTPGKPFPSLDLGENVRLEDDSVSGAALVFENRLLHLSAFRQQEWGGTTSRVPFRRFSERRR